MSHGMNWYSTQSPIFDDESVLREEYNPDRLPEREEEVNQLRMAFAPAARGQPPSNVFISGKAGQGKTAAVRRELSRLEQFFVEEDDVENELTTIYISFDLHNITTSFQAAGRIYMALTGNDRPTGFSTDAVMDMMFEAMNETGGVIIIVFDEIDTLDDDDRILYALSRARSQGYINDSVYPGVVGISNDLRWRESLSEKVKSSLYDSTITFSPYEAPELRSILYRRAAKAFADTSLTPIDEIEEKKEGRNVTIDNSGEYWYRSDTIESSVIELISGLAAKDTGDARQALDLILKASEIADRRDLANVKVDHVHEAKRIVEKEAVEQSILEMTTQARIILASLMSLEQESKTPATTNYIYKTYEVIANKNGTDPLVQKRVREHLKELRGQGLVESSKQGGGSIGAPSFHFELKIAPGIVEEALTSLPEDPLEVSHQTRRDQFEGK